MKKYTFNLDMIIVVIILFISCICASAYQRYLYGVLHDENMALQVKLITTELELIDVKTKLSTGSD